jgi:SAM-dependent methyltransferase
VPAYDGLVPRPATDAPRGSRPGPVYGSSRQGLLTRVAEPFATRSRELRHRRFQALVGLEAGERVIDVGCGPHGLAAFEPYGDVTGVDAVEQPHYPGAAFVRADAGDLPFADGSFEIAYANSLVEHLMPAERPAFAAEMRRVGGRYWVQTPNRYFPVEPHVLLPGFQFLPVQAQRRLWRLGASRGPFEEIHLLDEDELQRLFPDARIVREHFAGLTKSLIAVGPPEALGGEPG